MFLVRDEMIDLLKATDTKSKKQEEWLDPTAIPFLNGTQSKQRHMLIVKELNYEMKHIKGGKDKMLWSLRAAKQI